MAKYSRDIVAQVLSANDIVDVIGGYLDLRPSGPGRLKALCPFHQERDASFSVSRDRQMFYCFGCEKSGDAISFVSAFEGLSFVEALRKLADRAAIRLPAPTEREGREDYLRSQLIELGKFAAGYYVKMLNDLQKGEPGRKYLAERRLKPETAKRFGLGYAPEAWSGLLDASRAAGVKDSTIEASGLAKRGERGTLYDLFRNRLMFPIHDVSGNIVGFGGRDLGDQQAKYINSPESPIYKKSRVLYGLYEARDALRREQRAILVEGYFDLLRCFDAGIENVVATCGTALTSEQAGLLRRYAREVVVVFDGDAAGVRAALRGIAVLVAGGLTVRAILLPDLQDPDDFIKVHGGEAFRKLEADAFDLVAFYARMSGSRLDTIEGRTEVAKELFAILLDIEDELRRDEYVKCIARELRLNEWSCRNEFARFMTDRGSGRQETAGVAETAVRAFCDDDCDFVAVLLSDAQHLAQANASLEAVPLQPGALKEVLQEIFAGAGPGVGQRLASEDARRLYAAASNREIIAADRAGLVEKRVARLKIEALQAESARLQEEIRRENGAPDQAKELEWLRHKVEVRKRIEELGST